MRRYHILRANDALDDITWARPKIARPDDLNDPFEPLAAELFDKSMRRAFAEMRAEVARARGVPLQPPLAQSSAVESQRGPIPRCLLRIRCSGREVCAGFVRCQAPTKYCAQTSGGLGCVARTDDVETSNHEVPRLTVPRLSSGVPRARYDRSRQWALFRRLWPRPCVEDGNTWLRFVGQAVDFFSACRPKYTRVKIFVSRLAFRTFNVVERKGSTIAV
jgi:hypothetical protein